MPLEQQYDRGSVSPTGSSEPFIGQIASSIEDAIAHGTPGVPSPAVSPQAPVAPQEPMVPQVPVAPQAVVPSAPLPAQPPAPKDAPVISTAPVSPGVAKQFLDPQTASAQVPQLPQLPPDTPVEQPEEMSDKAKYAWIEIRNREKAARLAAEQYRQKMEQMETQSKTVASERAKFADELKLRDDKVKQLEDELGKLDLQHRPEFKSKYDVPLESLATEVAGIVKSETSATDDDNEARQIAGRMFSMDDDKFQEVVAQLPSPVQGSLWDKRRQARELMGARDHAVQEWRSTQAGVVAEDQQSQIVQRSERRREMADSAIDFAKNQTPIAKRLSVLVEPTYQQDVANVDTAFKGFMQEADDKAIARAAYQGFLVPVMQRQLAFMAEAASAWKEAYYAVNNLGKPPAGPMMVQSSIPIAPPVAAKPKVVEGMNFQDTVENTVESVLKQNGMQ